MKNNTKNKKIVLTRAKAIRMKGDAVIPDGVSEIGYELFAGNKKITSITVPGTVRKIDTGAFADCVNLETVILHEGVRSIFPSVFRDCHKLRRITLPDSVKICKCWSFNGTNLEEPVYNASGTRLFYCPESVSGKEWTVPDGVKIISAGAFLESKKLKVLHLPDGLKKIEKHAIHMCGLKELTIPYSVRTIEDNAIGGCYHLKRITVLNPKTKLGISAFYGCSNLKYIYQENLTETDRIAHLKGYTFLSQHIEDEANLNHRNDPEFVRLAGECAKGDVDAMFALSEWFRQRSVNPKASPFYRRASNYWRYRAYTRGSKEAAEWFERYFKVHRGERLESILNESKHLGESTDNLDVPGTILNDLGFSFFDPEKEYDIINHIDEQLVTVSSFDHYESLLDGFYTLCYYYWWFLDDNMQPIPEIDYQNAYLANKSNHELERYQAKAARILKERKKKEQNTVF